MEALLKQLRGASIVMENLPEQPGYNGSILQIDDTEAAAIVDALDAAIEALAQKCKGTNCGATDGRSHSAECFAEHDRAIGNRGGRPVMQQALEALCLPCDRWNKQQTLIVNAAIEALRNALDATSAEDMK